MMHGTFDVGQRSTRDEGIVARVRYAIMKRKWLLIVVLPTVLVALYYGMFAANQYVSEAHFIVRSTQSSAQAASGLSQALSMIGSVSTTPNDAASVSDYLYSHDAVETLAKIDRLVERFRRPEADLFSRLTPANPSPERLLKYYRRQIRVRMDPETGITIISARTFRPADSYELVNSLLRLGEQRVNVLNRRAYESSLSVAHRQLREAEVAVSQSQSALTAFRQGRRNIDPVATGQAQINVVAQLQSSLAALRAQRTAMAGSISSSSPQYLAIDGRVRALEAQMANEQGRLTGGASAIAANVGDYQSLVLRQQFASKRYDDAAAAVQRATEQASKQQLFIVRVVEPNMPVKALYPESGRVILTVFLALLLSYALGWLIAAGVREHSA